MTRYTKQYHTATCGPVALLNIAKWAGLNVTHKKDLLYYRKLCNQSDTSSGVNAIVINNALQELKFVKISKPREKPTLKFINDELAKNKILLLNVNFSKTHGHYTLCIGRTKDTYTCINMYTNRPALYKISGKNLSKCLKQTIRMLGVKGYSIAWPISKA